MSSKVLTFEKLDVFQRAYRLALEIHKISNKFPQDEQYVLADQLRRASKSICANIVEGCAKQFHSKREFRRYVVIAIGSSDETRLWCRFSRDLGYLSEAQWKKWRDELSEISKMLTGLYKHLS